MRRRLVISFVLIGMVVMATWPLAARLERGIPRGTESSSTVPVFNLWTVGWNLERVCRGWRHIWDAPHFHPTPKALAFSEPLLTSEVMLPVAWLSPTVAYNLFLLSALTLNASITWLALSHRRVAWPVALLASLVMVRLPCVHGQIGMLQSVLLAGIIGTIHFADEALRTRRLRDFLLAAACFDLTFLTCGYYGLFVALLAPVWCGAMIWQHWSKIVAKPIRSVCEALVSGRASPPRWRVGLVIEAWRQLIWGLIGAALILSLIVPLVLVQSRVLSDPFYERPRDLIQDLSAMPTDYLQAPFPEWFQGVGLSRWHEAGRGSFSPGIWKSALALCGVVIGLRSRRRQAWTLIWLTMSTGAFIGSLGLNFQIGSWSPYATLLDWMPTLSRLRTPARMSVIVQIGVVFLAAEALHWGFRCARVSGRHRHRVWRPALLGLFWIVGLTACFEVRLPQLSFVDVPPVESQRGWIEWLKQNTREDAVIAHVPFPTGPLARNYEGEAWAMYWGLFHQRRMVNGYSGFFPASYLELKSQMQSFPDVASFAALRSRGVTYCVVRQSFVDEHRLQNHPTTIQQWELAFRDDMAEVSIFRLLEFEAARAD